MADAGEPDDVRARASPARTARRASSLPVPPPRILSLSSRFDPRASRRVRARHALTASPTPHARAHAGADAVRAPARRAHRRERGDDAPPGSSGARVRASLALDALRLGRRGRRGPGRARQAPQPQGEARPERRLRVPEARVPHGASRPQGGELRRGRRRAEAATRKVPPYRRPRGRARPRRRDRRPGHQAGEPRLQVRQRREGAQPRDPLRGAYALPPRVVSPFPRTTPTPSTHSCARFDRRDARS